MRSAGKGGAGGRRAGERRSPRRIPGRWGVARAAVETRAGVNMLQLALAADGIRPWRFCSLAAPTVAHAWLPVVVRGHRADFALRSSLLVDLWLYCLSGFLHASRAHAVVRLDGWMMISHDPPLVSSSLASRMLWSWELVSPACWRLNGR
jgi:hypothetical protein